MVQDSGGLDVRVVATQRLRRLQITEMSKSDAPKKALADGIETHCAEILVNLRSAIRT
jgi:hypothetical protein